VETRSRHPGDQVLDVGILLGFYQRYEVIKTAARGLAFGVGSSQKTLPRASRRLAMSQSLLEPAAKVGVNRIVRIMLAANLFQDVSLMTGITNNIGINSHNIYWIGSEKVQNDRFW